MVTEPDYRTDRVALRIDALIPELQALLEDLRHEVNVRNVQDDADDARRAQEEDQ